MAKLYFKYGAMGSSKSAQALITKFNYEERDMTVWLIKPATDTRDGQDIIRSRIGLSAKAEAITPDEDIIEAWQKQLYPRYGLHFIHASDEFYLLAGRPLPEEARYDGYLQLENGVGMIRLFSDQFDAALKRFRTCRSERRVTIVTGMLAYPVIRDKCAALCEKFPSVRVDVVPVVNRFFGEGVTVAGLLTGQDVIARLKERDNGDVIFIPKTMLRSGEDVFLDDLHVGDAEEALGVPIYATDCDGESLVRALLEKEKKEPRRLFRPYEPKENEE